MPSLAVDIVRFAECVLRDGFGQPHTFVDKVPLVSLEDRVVFARWPGQAFIRQMAGRRVMRTRWPARGCKLNEFV
jgi:hypothetical protein